MDFIAGVNDIPLGIEDEASIESARPIMHSGARHDDAAEAVSLCSQEPQEFRSLLTDKRPQALVVTQTGGIYIFWQQN